MSSLKTMNLIFESLWRKCLRRKQQANVLRHLVCLSSPPWGGLKGLEGGREGMLRGPDEMTSMQSLLPSQVGNWLIQENRSLKKEASICISKMCV